MYWELNEQDKEHEEVLKSGGYGNTGAYYVSLTVGILYQSNR